MQLQGYLDKMSDIQTFLRSLLVMWPNSAAGSRVKSTPEPSVPINLRALDLIEAIDEVRDRVGTSIAEVINRPAEKFTVWAKGKPRETYLDGVERALYLRNIWRLADSIIGFEKTWQKRHAPCGSCHLPTLGCWLGEDLIRCTNSECGAVITKQQYEDHCLSTSRGS